MLSVPGTENRSTGEAGELVAVVRLYVPDRMRLPYLAVMAKLGTISSVALRSCRLLEEKDRSGFFLEVYRYASFRGYLAALGGAEPGLAELFAERRRLIPEDQEEKVVYRDAS